MTKDFSYVGIGRSSNGDSLEFIVALFSNSEQDVVDMQTLHSRIPSLPFESVPLNPPPKDTKEKPEHILDYVGEGRHYHFLVVDEAYRRLLTPQGINTLALSSLIAQKQGVRRVIVNGMLTQDEVRGIKSILYPHSLSIEGVPHATEHFAIVNDAVRTANYLKRNSGRAIDNGRHRFDAYRIDPNTARFYQALTNHMSVRKEQQPRMRDHL